MREVPNTNIRARLKRPLAPRTDTGGDESSVRPAPSLEEGLGAFLTPLEELELAMVLVDVVEGAVEGSSVGEGAEKGDESSSSEEEEEEEEEEEDAFDVHKEASGGGGASLVGGAPSGVVTDDNPSGGYDRDRHYAARKKAQALAAAQTHANRQKTHAGGRKAAVAAARLQRRMTREALSDGSISRSIKANRQTVRAARVGQRADAEGNGGLGGGGLPGQAQGTERADSEVATICPAYLRKAHCFLHLFASPLHYAASLPAHLPSLPPLLCTPCLNARAWTWTRWWRSTPGAAARGV